MYGQGYAQPGYAQPGGYAPAYGAPVGYAAAPSYGGGGGAPRAPATADDLERVMRTVHVGGIRGLKGQPGINPGEEITEDDLAAFFGNDGEVVGVRINGSNCWIEFAEAAGAISALAKDGTESGGHHLRVSASKTPIRSNGYLKGRQIQLERAKERATASGSPAPTTAAAAPTEAARQMSVDEIVNAVRVEVNHAVEAAKAQGTLVTVAPPPTVAAVSAAVNAGG